MSGAEMSEKKPWERGKFEDVYCYDDNRVEYCDSSEALTADGANSILAEIQRLQAENEHYKKVARMMAGTLSCSDQWSDSHPEKILEFYIKKELSEENSKDCPCGGPNYEVLTQVDIERCNQDQKWGEQNHDIFIWLSILGEEVGEANKAALEER